MSWTKLHTDNSLPLNNIFFINTDTGYAVGGEKFERGIVLQTVNGGQSWTSYIIGSKTFYGLDFVNGQKGIVVGMEGFIFKTDNGWASYQSNENYNNWGKPYFDIQFVNDSVGFIAGGSAYKKGFIYKTTDRGNNWSEKTFERELRSIEFTDEKTGFISGYGIIYKTTDGGESWKPTDAKGDFFVGMDFTSANVGYAVGYEGTIIKTTNAGGSWEKLRNGNNVLLKNMQFEAIKFFDGNTGYAVGRKGVMIKTDDGGDSWKIVKNASDENMKSIFLLNSSSGFVTTESGNIYRFSN